MEQERLELGVPTDRFCKKCGRFHPEEDFYPAPNDRRETVCKECQKDGARKRHKEHRVMLRQRAFDYLKAHPCTCGESDPIVLEFHHKAGAEKLHDISYMLSRAFSWAVVLEEIKKCIVLCANCHRRETALEAGWYKDVIDKGERD